MTDQDYIDAKRNVLLAELNLVSDGKMPRGASMWGCEYLEKVIAHVEDTGDIPWWAWADEPWGGR